MGRVVDVLRGALIAEMVILCMIVSFVLLVVVFPFPILRLRKSGCSGKQGGAGGCG
jgi:hypothetical protein